MKAIILHFMIGYEYPFNDGNGRTARCGFGKDLNFRQVQLLKKVLRDPGRLFVAKEVKNDFDVSEGTARADLEKLVKLKLLAKVREGKTWCYVARGDAAAQIRKK